MAEAWDKVNVPVMAAHGEYDCIMSADDYKLLVNASNARPPGSAQLIEWTRADHLLYTHASEQKAPAFRTKIRSPAHRSSVELAENFWDCEPAFGQRAAQFFFRQDFEQIFPEILQAGSNSLRRFYRRQNRVYLKFDQVAPALDPLIEQRRIVGLHDLETALEVLIDPT